jgi:hypothetical protein
VELQEKVVPETVLLKVIPVDCPEHSAVLPAKLPVGIGLTVTVYNTGLPGQLLAVGVTE